jgi:hypothetical protein
MRVIAARAPQADDPRRMAGVRRERLPVLEPLRAFEQSDPAGAGFAGFLSGGPGDDVSRPTTAKEHRVSK